MPSHHEAEVHFSDGQSVTYKVPVIMAQDYTIDNIFEKRLLALLPYYIMRYEHFLKSDGKDQKKLKMLLDDYQKIDEKIQELEEENRSYVDLIEWIKRIADHVIPNGNPVKERIDVMGGQLLKLKSEELREEGITEGRLLELCSSVQDGDMAPERAAKRLQMTLPELRQKMLEKGYRFPEI